MNEDITKFYNDDGTEFNPDLIPKPAYASVAGEMDCLRRKIFSAILQEQISR